ncbi:MAG: hypothetical protein QF632_03825 [Candidatus Woesearchaeota archaeon]|jgi:hypothetical protein|nr:hypothetical protein [Candidatus Woesearchaeota archaeon]
MLCSKCKKFKVRVEISHLGSLCANCFCKIFEKRIRKSVRIDRVFSKNDRILVSDKLSEYLVKEIIKGMPVKIFFRKLDDDFVKREKINKVVVGWTLDDEVNQFLEKLLFNRKSKEVKYVKLLKSVTDEEVEAFVKIKKIKFSLNEKNEDISEFISVLNEKYDDIKFGLGKSIKKLKS